MSITFEDIEKAQYKLKEEIQSYGRGFYVFNLNGTVTVLDAEDVDKILAEDADTNPI